MKLNQILLFTKLYKLILKIQKIKQINIKKMELIK